MRSSFRVAMLSILLAQSSLGPPRVTAQARATGDWPMYRHDTAGTGYSPLTQIDITNAGRLVQVWTYRLQSDAPAVAAGGGRGGPGGPNSEATPIVVNGVMYLPAANRVVALEPETGKELWQHRVTGGAPSRRGVAYWPGDGTSRPRIIFTSGRRLFALDASNGALVQGFGKDGEVDLVVPYNSVPLVHKNVVVVGANTPPGAAGGIGNARAFDARTGARRWEFSSVAQPGTVGHDTWEGDSWRGRLGVNAWPFYFTVDEARGLLYVPLASPVPGSYGGDRKGANLFGNSVVAVDIQTGKYRWHFQTIHHDLWDADPPAPPGLIDVVRNGRTIPALALTTKSGYLYVLNRETGQPIFGVEERAVAKSDVPGEATFPTQPFPIKPPPLARNTYMAGDLVTAADTTAEHAKACGELIDKNGGVSNEGPFTPWRYRAEGATPGASLVFPGGLGGANWGGTAFDPRSRFVFVATQDVGALGWIEKAREGSAGAYDKVTLPGGGAFAVRMGDGTWPCQKPPWGRLTAVNASTGDVAWQIPLGITDQLPVGKQNTGRPVLAGPIVTAGGVLFIASTDDNRFRALDAKTGRELWVTRLERRGNANPLTYEGRNGRQYVAIVATDTVVVYALPGASSDRLGASLLGAQSGPNDGRARAIFKELIEINTTDTPAGNVTTAAEAVAARLKAAGFAAGDIQVLGPDTRKGNVIVRYRGTGARRPLLLLAHLDVVEAKPEDWSFDPFVFLEKDGFFYGRGTSDDKSMAAQFVANLIRLKEEHFTPDRDLILALTADEEGGTFNGVEWLVKNHKALIDAEFAINEGGGGNMRKGKYLTNEVQASEKVFQDFRLEVTNRGGHSSLPVKDNAIYHLSAGLARLAAFDFPIRLNEVTRAYFQRSASVESDPKVASDMRAVARETPDLAAAARLSAALPYWNSMMRTTCVATRLFGGHANNALPQLATANVNCRILPGESPAAVKDRLVEVLADPKIAVAFVDEARPSKPSPLRPDVMGVVESLTKEMFPGVVVVPVMSTGATDGLYLRNGEIPTYGVDATFGDIDDVRAHGRDERVGVKQFFEGLEFQYRLIKALAVR